MMSEDEFAEMDSNANEDPARELQLDDSYSDWYRNIAFWALQKEKMTQVPKESVFDAVESWESKTNVQEEQQLGE